MRILHFFRVRRRDAVMLLFVWLLSCACFLSSLSLCWVSFVHVPRVRNRFDSVASVCTNYLSQATQIMQRYSDDLISLSTSVSPSSNSPLTPTNTPPSEKILGRGCVRAFSGRFIPYVDVKLPDGQVERRYGK